MKKFDHKFEEFDKKLKDVITQAAAAAAGACGEGKDSGKINNA